MRWWIRLRNVVVYRILGLNDTPHRIAWGVFLGFVVAFSPTVGFQMALYVAAASLFRANRLAGIPIVWITNPATIAPIYYFCWWLGALVLGSDTNAQRAEDVMSRLSGSGSEFSWSRLLEADFWSELGAAMWSLGAELWLGGFIVGAALGAICYPLTLYGVRSYRAIRHRHDGEHDEAGEGAAEPEEAEADDAGAREDVSEATAPDAAAEGAEAEEAEGEKPGRTRRASAP